MDYVISILVRERPGEKVKFCILPCMINASIENNKTTNILRLLLVIIFSFASINSWCQCENFENSKLKATYIICDSSPNDTTFSFFYYYNPDNSLNRIERYRYKKLESINKYVYNENGRLITIQEIIPQTYESLCGNSLDDSCLNYFKDKIVSYDTVNSIYYFLAYENEVKSEYDSIFQNDKLIAVLSGIDTLHTFQYDSNNILIRKNNYCNNAILNWITYQYKQQLQIEHHYNQIGAKPNLKIESKFNNLNQLVKRTKIYFFKKAEQPSNNNITEEFEYDGRKLKVYKLYDNYIDPCSNYYCCGRYTKLYEYKE